MNHKKELPSSLWVLGFGVETVFGFRACRVLEFGLRARRVSGMGLRVWGLVVSRLSKQKIGLKRSSWGGGCSGLNLCNSFDTLRKKRNVKGTPQRDGDMVKKTGRANRVEKHH